MPSQKKAAALYMAPVVQEKYRQIVSHFEKPKNSYNGQRLAPITREALPGYDTMTLALIDPSQETKSRDLMRNKTGNDLKMTSEFIENKSHQFKKLDKFAVAEVNDINPTIEHPINSLLETDYDIENSKARSGTTVLSNTHRIGPNNEKFQLYLQQKKMQNKDHKDHLMVVKQQLVQPRQRNGIEQQIKTVEVGRKAPLTPYRVELKSSLEC